MIVIDPNDTTHFIRVIPRNYDNNANTFNLYDETNRDTTSITNTKVLSNGFAIYEVDLTVSEGEEFSVKINDGNTVVWRGKIFVTSQTTQAYKING